MIVKKCIAHGDLTEDQVIKSGKHKLGHQQYKCRQCMKEYHRSHYINHKEKVLQKCKDRKLAAPEKYKKIKYNSWLRHREKHLEKENLRRKKFKESNPEYYHRRDRIRVATLEDTYVKKTLTLRSGLKNGDLPQELVDFKREVLKLRRLVRKKMKENKLLVGERADDKN